MVLFVDEAESIARQTETRPRSPRPQRGGRTVQGSANAGRNGRPTSSEGSPATATGSSRSKPTTRCVSLKQIFHYHFINAQAPIPSGAGQHRPRAGVSELAGARSAHLRPASEAAAGQRNRPPCPAGPRAPARQLRGGAAGDLRTGHRVHRSAR